MYFITADYFIGNANNQLFVEFIYKSSIMLLL